MGKTWNFLRHVRGKLTTRSTSELKFLSCWSHPSFGLIFRMMRMVLMGGGGGGGDDARGWVCETKARTRQAVILVAQIIGNRMPKNNRGIHLTEFFIYIITIISNNFARTFPQPFLFSHSSPGAFFSTHTKKSHGFCWVKIVKKMTLLR